MLMSGLYIYEIGAISYWHKKGMDYKYLDWRMDLDNFALDNGFKTFNPGVTYQKEVNRKYNTILCVHQNDFYINQSTLAVANLEAIEHSPGSIYELVRFKLQNKPVIAFGECKWDWSPHLMSCISYRCKDLEEVKELLCTMFNQNNMGVS